MAGASPDTHAEFTRNLYYFGLWEPNLSAWIESRLSPGDVFIDVGANMATHSARREPRRPIGAVVAVEAMPAIFQHLGSHVSANGLTNLPHQ